MWFHLGIVLVALASFQAGTAIYCPIAQCTAPILCQDLTMHHSFMNFGDLVCPMCPTCDVTGLLGVGRRAVSYQCPVLMCPPVDCPNGFLSTNIFSVNGHVCTGCPVCRDTRLTERKLAPSALQPYLGCPIVECAYPGPCLGGYHYHSYMSFHGRNCTGCPYCLNNQLLGW